MYLWLNEDVMIIDSCVSIHNIKEYKFSVYFYQYIIYPVQSIKLALSHNSAPLYNASYTYVLLKEKKM